MAKYGKITGNLSLLIRLIMPVPKRKTSKQRKNKRRAHHALDFPELVKDKDSGKLRRPHRVSKQTGRYKGEEVISTD